MRVLVACEFSGIVREAFRAKGHDAWSCDLLETEIPGKHYVGDVRDMLDQHWDLMVAHPPCTYLARCNARRFKDKRVEQTAAMEFVQTLWNANVGRIALENPIGVISKRIRKPDQVIQPWQFGHEATKATCLWLKELPKLQPTMVMEVRNKNLTSGGHCKLGSDIPDRWKIRSRTYPGIAAAMADQWG